MMRRAELALALPLLGAASLADEHRQLLQAPS
jgi:hypothetical protein